MARINLRDFYPFYRDDCFVDVPDNVAVELMQWERNEQNVHRKKRRYHAQYSLDYGGSEHEVVFTSMTPDEQYIRKVNHEELYAALSMLPSKQALRIYGHYILGTSVQHLAIMEGVTHQSIGVSIQRGLHRLEHILKNCF